jgi:threonine 3-dehydrogenase
MSKLPKVLITGANGQIGTVLTQSLRQRYGSDQVVASDIRQPDESAGPFVFLDICDQQALQQIVKEYGITQIYHLAAILSAKGEANPLGTWQLNMDGLFNVLETARICAIDRVFFPSSIAVFGPKTPKTATPQFAYLDPTTVYGISKQAGEQWANYYHVKYGLDIRSVRYPGIIGHQSAAGGGTTDYAVEIFHYALEHQPYTCFLKENTRLPMMYMDDAIRATIELMETPASNITVRTSYNLSGMDFTPAEITRAIQQYFPDFRVDYQPDFRQAIADSWNNSIDDQYARRDWGWQAHFDLETMTSDMIQNLKKKIKPAQPLS